MSQFITIVTETSEVVGVEDTQALEVVEIGNGLSAYQIAVIHGFVGTEAEWLASLQGGGGGGSETTTTMGALINSATAKAVPVDADMLLLMDSAAANVGKKLSWANLKATAKAYFDTLYQPLAAVLTATTAAFTTAQETKLAGIATGATANSPDATLLARANHTGTQAASTISDFSTAADARAAAAIATHFPTQTAGGVLFADGSAILVQDNATFFYDNTNNTLRLLESAYNVAAAGWNSSSPSALQIGNNNTPHTFGSNPGFFGQKIDIYGAASSGNFKQLSGIRVRAQFAATGTSNGHTTTAIEAFVSNPDDTTANANALLQCLEGIVQVPKTIGRAAAGYFVVNAGGAANPTVTTQYGVFSQIGNAGAFSTTDAILYNGWAVTGSGVVTNLYGLRLAGWSGTGVVNSYGIYIEASIDLGTTLKYAFYSLSTSPSLFSGPVSGVINAYDATAWNGSAKFATEDAIRDKIEALVTAIAALAADSAVVHNTGNETVAGVKTFSSSPVVPAPTTDLQAATKKYVDDAVTAGGGYTDELAQDAAAALFTPDDGDVDYTYNDATPSITSTIKAAAVSLAKMASVATGTIFYRKTAGTGDPEVQTLATLKTDLGLTGTNSGDETASTLGATINGASAATPNNTDLVATVESSVVKKITWTNVKAFLKTYFDTLYAGVLGADDNYVTDAEKVKLSNLSGTNTGDQTSVSGNAATATTLQTARNIDGQSFNGSADITVIAPGTVAATSKTTPVDADVMPIADSAASNVLKKLTWANLKATLKTYLDTLYQPLDGDLTTIAGLTATTDNFIVSVASAWASRTPAQVKTTLSLNNVDNTSNATERAATATLENKRIKPRTGTTTSSATPTINTDNVDFYSLTAQTADITSFTTNLSGTPTEGQKLWIAITGTAARAITWGASFEAGAVALPTTTVTTARLDVGFVWNTVTSKWRCMASG